MSFENQTRGYYSVSRNIYTNTFSQLYNIFDKKIDIASEITLSLSESKDDARNNLFINLVHFIIIIVVWKPKRDRLIDSSYSRWDWPFWIFSDKAQRWKQANVKVDERNSSIKLIKLPPLLCKSSFPRRICRKKRYVLHYIQWFTYRSFEKTSDGKNEDSEEIPKARSRLQAASLKIQRAYRAGLGNAMRV